MAEVGARYLHAGAAWFVTLGAVILFLNRYIPESPRFLSNAGLEDQARAGGVRLWAGTMPESGLGSQAALGAALAKRYGIRSEGVLTSCSTCHR